MDTIAESQDAVPQTRHVGTFVNDPTFDDWMEKLSAIRRAANATVALEHIDQRTIGAHKPFSTSSKSVRYSITLHRENLCKLGAK